MIRETNGNLNGKMTKERKKGRGKIKLMETGESTQKLLPSHSQSVCCAIRKGVRSQGSRLDERQRRGKKRGMLSRKYRWVNLNP